MRILTLYPRLVLVPPRAHPIGRARRMTASIPIVVHRLFLGLFLLLALPLPGQAQTSADQEARALFEAGRVAFEANRYADALGHFQRAFDLSRRFQLQYNLGLAYDRLRRDEEAVQAFEAYLTGDSTGDRADEVRARVQAIKASIAARAAPVPVAAPAKVVVKAEPAAPAVDTDRSALRKRRIWIAVGSVLAVAVGVTVGVVVAAGDDPPKARPEPNTGIHVEALSW